MAKYEIVEMKNMANGVNREEPSKMAEGIVIHRTLESLRPERERICYDPYAKNFISPEILELGVTSPDEAVLKWRQQERLYPGMHNSIVARVRYFDDFVKQSIDKGIEQLVILGAGYDTRAYRIEGINKVKVFEVDHPNTQSFKIQKIKKIFGSTPDHVVYVPVDFEKETLGQSLFDGGYDSSKRTLFVMEGFVMYIPPKVVDLILSFIVENSGNRSAVIFDYFPEPVINGTCRKEAGKNLVNLAKQMEEPLQFGINDGMVRGFLSMRGFSRIQNVTSKDYKEAYFGGKEYRTVCDLLYFVHASIK